MRVRIDISDEESAGQIADPPEVEEPLGADDVAEEFDGGSGPSDPEVGSQGDPRAAMSEPAPSGEPAGNGHRANDAGPPVFGTIQY